MKQIHLTIITIGIFAFLSVPSFALSPQNADVPTVDETYSRAQIDSILSVAVSKNLDTLVEMKTYERLGTYINEENNHLTIIEIFVALLSVFFAGVSIVAPYLINKRKEKALDEKMELTMKLIDEKQRLSLELIKERQNDSKAYLDNYMKDSVANTRETINQLVEKGLSEVNELIDDHDIKIKEQQSSIDNIHKEVQALADDAKKSKEEAAYSAKASKAYEYVSKSWSELNFDKRIELCMEAIKIIPNNAYLYLNLASVYSLNKDLDNALINYSKAIELEPEYTFAYHNRGNIYFKKGEFEKAIIDYTKVIEHMPDFSPIYRDRGESYKRIGDNAKADADFKKARELDQKGKEDDESPNKMSNR